MFLFPNNHSTYFGKGRMLRSHTETQRLKDIMQQHCKLLKDWELEVIDVNNKMEDRNCNIDNKIEDGECLFSEDEERTPRQNAPCSQLSLNFKAADQERLKTSQFHSNLEIRLEREI